MFRSSMQLELLNRANVLPIIEKYELLCVVAALSVYTDFFIATSVIYIYIIMMDNPQIDKLQRTLIVIYKLYVQINVISIIMT